MSKNYGNVNNLFYLRLDNNAELWNRKDFWTGFLGLSYWKKFTDQCNSFEATTIFEGKEDLHLI